MTVERDTGACIGFHVLNHIRGESIIQVGFTLVKSAWGKGFAAEMAAAVLRYGFVDLKLPRIAGMASLQNYASQRVLLKIGLRDEASAPFPIPTTPRKARWPGSSAMGSNGWPIAFPDRERK